MAEIKTYYSEEKQILIWKFEEGCGRTPIQFEIVKAITQQPDFGYMTSHRNLFGNSFQETSALLFCYFTKDGILHTQRIGKGGTILRHVLCPSDVQRDRGPAPGPEGKV